MNQAVQTDRHCQKFLDDFVSGLTKEYGTELVSIALFGSAATGEWVLGRSDIDLIIVIGHESLRGTVEDYINNLILELDRKHGLQLSQTCSVFARHNNFIINFFHKTEGLLMFGKPFYVFPLDQIAFEKGTVSDAKIRFVTGVFDPLSIFLAKMKYTGITLYGQNLIAKIRFSNSPLTKIRVALAPLWLVAMSLLSFPFDESFALKHSMKATVWASEDMLFALDIPLSSMAQEVQTFIEIFAKNKTINVDHLIKTVSYRSRKTSDIHLSRGFVAKYILSTILFILTLYYETILAIRRRR